MGVANWHFAYWPSIDKFSNCSWIGRTDPNCGGKIYAPKIKACSRDDKHFAAKQPFRDKAEGSEKCNPGVKVKSTAASLWGVGGQRGRGGHCHIVNSGRTGVVVKARSLVWCNKPSQSQCSLKSSRMEMRGNGLEKKRNIDEKYWKKKKPSAGAGAAAGLPVHACQRASVKRCSRTLHRFLHLQLVSCWLLSFILLIVVNVSYRIGGAMPTGMGSLWKMHPDSCLGLPPLTCRAHQS